MFDLPTALARLTTGPAAALRLNAGRLAVGAAADLVLFDPDGQTVVGENWHSKGRNCPFMNHVLPGAVRYTLLNGKITHKTL